jgi:hypothetical protein
VIPRRKFLRTVSLGTTMIGGASVLQACAAQSASARSVLPPSPASRPQSTKWDMSWVARVNRPHRVVFDVAKVAEGVALFQASTWMYGYAEAEGATDNDLNAVLVFRHAAVTMVLGDAMWARLGISSGQTHGAADSTATSTPKPPTGRNPYLGDASPASEPPAGMDGRVTIRRLMSRGAIILACNNALRGQAYGLKEKENLSEADAYAQVRAAVTPGVYVMPNGIFSVARAQEAGCSLFMPG